MTHILRALAPFATAILALAGCADLPGRPAPAARAETRYEPTPFAAVPGWQVAALAPGLRAFVAGCPRIAADSALRRACELAKSVPPEDEGAARQIGRAHV